MKFRLTLNEAIIVGGIIVSVAAFMYRLDNRLSLVELTQHIMFGDTKDWKKGTP